MRCLDTPPSSSVPSGGEFDAGLSWPVSVSPAPPFHSHGFFFEIVFFFFHAVCSGFEGDGITLVRSETVQNSAPALRSEVQKGGRRGKKSAKPQKNDKV